METIKETLLKHAKLVVAVKEMRRLQKKWVAISPTDVERKAAALGFMVKSQNEVDEILERDFGTKRDLL